MQSTMIHFVPLNEQWGVKLYKFQLIRDRAHRFQQLAAELHLGPLTSGSIDLPDDVKHRCGYITQIVKLCYTGKKPWHWHKQNRHVLNPIIAELKEQIGFKFKDYHGWNWGIHPQTGLPIPIDFGEQQ